jgi:hypothetical protein
MSAMENAAHLEAAGARAREEIESVVQQVNAEIQNLSSLLEQAKVAAENGTNTAANILGEGHMATGAIVAAAATVVEQVEQIRGLLSQVELESGTISGAAQQLQETYAAAAQGQRGGA